MTLIKCPECGKEVSDKAAACPSCGCPISLTEGLFCPACGKANEKDSAFCAYCGKRLNENVSNAVSEKPARHSKNVMDHVSRPSSTALLASQDYFLQSEAFRLREEQFSSMARCPKCGSTSLAGGKKGFGIGKAAVGALAVGPVGLLAGGIGMNKATVTCMSCGYQFKL